MPELPDLEVICEYLAPRLTGQTIASAEVRRPLVVRNLLGGDVVGHLTGCHFAGVARRGKFLIFSLTSEGAGESCTCIVVNPMLAGRFRYGEPLGRDRTRDALVLGLAESGHELRYHDARDMGKIYLVRDLARVPTFADLGPDANSAGLTLDVFRQRLRRHRGEVKGVLTNQSFVAGIGNAYADEICWLARIYPFRRRPRISEDEVISLYDAMRTTLDQAINTLRERVGSRIDVEVRDFLAVHGREGQPCPRCGTAISSVTRARRTTYFCRQCQPGLMVTGPGRAVPRGGAGQE
ncbi:MAG: DNA-formamidopyrimidine glycosylase family protein [Anaerolineae bacterium]|jgi:formamidopyrimidine-DNA glycosylase